MPDCSFTNPDNCLGNAVGNLAGSAIDSFVASIADGVVNSLKTLSTVWMSVPSPDVQHSRSIDLITSDLQWYTAAAAVAGLLFALARTGIQMRVQPMLTAVRMLVTLIVVTGCATVVVGTGIAAGDKFAPWIIERAAGQPFASGVDQLITANMLTSNGAGMGLIIGVLALLGSLGQIVFMLVRAALIPILMGILATLAAASGTETGALAMRKAAMTLLALVLYKPVAAVVYAVGFLLIKGDATTTGVGQSTGLMSLLEGLTVIILAALTLPALVRALVPMAATGASSAYSGGAVLGAVATGAAVVSSMGAATAGAGAAAAGRTGAGAATGGTVAGGGAGPQSAGGASPSPGRGAGPGGGSGGPDRGGAGGSSAGGSSPSPGGSGSGGSDAGGSSTTGAGAGGSGTGGGPGGSGRPAGGSDTGPDGAGGGTDPGSAGGAGGSGAPVVPPRQGRHSLAAAAAGHALGRAADSSDRLAGDDGPADGGPSGGEVRRQ